MSWKSLGNFIRHKREALGLSRAEFDEKFHIAAGTLRNLEGGYNNFSSSMLQDFANIFNVAPGLLINILSDKITLEQALVLDEETNLDLLGDGKYQIVLPENFNSGDIHEVQEFVNYIQYRKTQSVQQPPRGKPVTYQDLIDTGESLSPGEDMKQVDKIIENKESVDKN
jgi:transcriptional regulator with XRE-family HTH domain